MSIKPVNVFVTPDSVKDLEDRIENFSGGERAAAWKGALMAWNLACKLVDEATDAEELAVVWQEFVEVSDEFVDFLVERLIVAKYVDNIEVFEAIEIWNDKVTTKSELL